MSHIEVTIRLNTPDQAEWLPNLLDTAGVNGWQEQHNYLAAYVDPDSWPTIQPIWADTLRLYDLHYDTNEIADQNWNATWEKHFQPLVINDVLAVRATFHAPVTHTRHEIIIDPTRAFGTGHHETTYMMLHYMSSLDVSGRHVLDFGCGTGILAIYACMLGAGTVWANDIEEPAIEIARKNAQLNHTPLIKFVLGGLDCVPDMLFDTILANIHRSVLVSSMPHLAAILAPAGQAILSGILLEDLPHMESALTANNLKVLERRTLGRWHMWVAGHAAA